MTAEETMTLHKELGTDGFFDYLKNSKGHCDIPSFIYILKLQISEGILKMPPVATELLFKSLDALSKRKSTDRDIEMIMGLIDVAREMYEDGSDIPADMPYFEMRTHRPGPKVTKKKKRRKK